MQEKHELEILHKLIEALKDIGAGLHDIADALRQGPEDAPPAIAPQYLDQGIPHVPNPPRDIETGGF